MNAQEKQAKIDRFNEGDLNDANLNDAQKALKKAYLLLSFGHFDEALAACSEAARLCPGNSVAPALHGAILIAAGRTNDAIQFLSRIIRRYPNDALPRLYFCEACLLGGRFQRGMKELEKIGATLPEDSPWREFYENLRATFDGLEPKEIPAPLVVPPASEEATLQG